MSSRINCYRSALERPAHSPHPSWPPAPNPRVLCAPGSPDGGIAPHYCTMTTSRPTAESTDAQRAAIHFGVGLPRPACVLPARCNDESRTLNSALCCSKAPAETQSEGPHHSTPLRSRRPDPRTASTLCGRSRPGSTRPEPPWANSPQRPALHRPRTAGRAQAPCSRPAASGSDQR